MALAAGCRGKPAADAAAPLRVGLPTLPLGLDPHHHDEFATVSALSNVFEALTRLDSALRVEPGLAIGWGSPDERTWHFELRRGVSFHDGRPLTAEDVVFSLRRARTHPVSEFKSYLAGVGSVSALDDQRVQIVTERPLAMLLNQLSFVMIVPSGSPERIDEPVGTGPYRVAIATASELRLEAFDGHWGDPPAEPVVRLVLASDRETGVGKLLAGELDLLTDVAPGDIEPLRSAGLSVLSWPLPSVEVLRPSLAAGPFSDPRVRRAVHLALDREDLVERMALGYGRPASQLVTRDVFGYDPELAPAKRDLPEARRLLSAAGYRQGLDVSLEVRAGRDAGVIAEQLAEAGIRATLAPRPWRELIATGPGRPSTLTHFALLADSGDAGLLFDSTLHGPDAARGFGDTNRVGYVNPQLDLLIEAASEEPDLAGRLALLQRCMRLAMDDLPFIPLIEQHRAYAHRKGLRWQLRHDGRVLAGELRLPRP